MKHYFWDKAFEDLIEAGSSFEYRSSNSSVSGIPRIDRISWTLFSNNNDDEGLIILSRSILRMHVEREEVSFCNIKFESKAQRHQLFDKWARHIIVLNERSSFIICQARWDEEAT